MTREELIAALEKLTGPDRAADFWCWWWGKARHDGSLPDRDYIAANIRRGDAPRYTSSTDAAMTLVRETTDMTLGRIWCVKRWAEITDGQTTWRGESFNEATALSVAALKAQGDKS